ncbi:hypothetical protein M885DRAFT_613751 [Pelagophyceae sp. CCMP2097]|nr:hypothetical protein M885DRAFT_613751 [Pelagophyceae sp. CCMP2097]|mmetsp:Transcript_11508/g.40538  ORF Transcript_11508/g.40538 Transcript_11508/m.40538 type:complete len:456 (-) Transcript_11508:51-1418(-)
MRRGVPDYEFEASAYTSAVNEMKDIKYMMKEMQKLQLQAKQRSNDLAEHKSRAVRSEEKHDRAVRTALAAIDEARAAEGFALKRQQRKDREVWKRDQMDQAKLRRNARASEEASANRAARGKDSASTPASASASSTPRPTPRPRDYVDDEASSWQHGGAGTPRDGLPLPPLPRRKKPFDVEDSRSSAPQLPGVPSRVCPTCRRKFATLMHLLMHDASGCRAKPARKPADYNADYTADDSDDSARRRKAAGKGTKSSEARKREKVPAAKRRTSFDNASSKYFDDASSKSDPCKSEPNVHENRRRSSGSRGFGDARPYGDARPSDTRPRGRPSRPPPQPPQGTAAKAALHEVAWARLRDAESISFADVPWPRDQDPQSDAGAFACIGIDDTDDLETRRRAVRAASLRWHPDKFIQLFGRKILDPAEREKILEGLGAMARRINALRERTHSEAAAVGA